MSYRTRIHRIQLSCRYKNTRTQDKPWSIDHRADGQTCAEPQYICHSFLWTSEIQFHGYKWSWVSLRTGAWKKWVQERSSAREGDKPFSLARARSFVRLLRRLTLRIIHCFIFADISCSLDYLNIQCYNTLLLIWEFSPSTFQYWVVLWTE